MGRDQAIIHKLRSTSELEFPPSAEAWKAAWIQMAKRPGTTRMRMEPMGNSSTMANEQRMPWIHR